MRIYIDSGGPIDVPDGGQMDFLTSQMQQALGLATYGDLSYDDRVELEAEYPFFYSVDNIGVMLRPLFESDGGASTHKLNSLLAHDQLEIRPHCKIAISDNDWSMTGEAIGQVALALEYIGWEEEMKGTAGLRTGYDLPDPDEMEAARRELRKKQKKHSGFAFAVGNALTSPLMSDRRHHERRHRLEELRQRARAEDIAARSLRL